MSILKKIRKIFEPSPYEIRRIPNEYLSGRPKNDDNIDIGVLYEIEDQSIYGDENPDRKHYSIAFSTPKLQESYGEDYERLCNLDPFNFLISFDINLKYLPDYEIFYYTHIVIYENCIILFVNKKDYVYYISKKIPRNIAYPINNLY
jgi:hypothetical protein